jgi:hypothetical protein
VHWRLFLRCSTDLTVMPYQSTGEAVYQHYRVLSEVSINLALGK